MRVPFPIGVPSSVSGRLREHGTLFVIGAMAVGAALARVSLCPFATLTGLPCPGCGLLRATLAAFRGHFAESFHLHPLALVAVPAATFAAFRLRSAAPMTRRAHVAFTVGIAWLVVAMVSVWIARFGGALGGPVSVNSIFTAETGTFTR